MCNFLFGDSVLTLNYKYNQATSSAKTFSNSNSPSRCKPKEYPPNPRSDWGVLDEMVIWKRFVLKRNKFQFNPTFLRPCRTKSFPRPTKAPVSDCFEKDAEYGGGDITHRLRGVKSAQDCQKLCMVMSHFLRLN